MTMSEQTMNVAMATGGWHDVFFKFTEIPQRLQMEALQMRSLTYKRLPLAMAREAMALWP